MKAKRTILIVSAIIIITSAVFLTLILWDGNYTPKKVNLSSAVINKVETAELNGGSLKLTNQDINEIAGTYFGAGKKKGNVTVKSVSVDILNGSMKIYMPVKYRFLNMLLTTEGKFLYENKKFTFIPCYFRIGKMPLPKFIAVRMLRRHMNSSVNITENQISVQQDKLPVKIDSLDIKNNELTAEVKKIEIPNIAVSSGSSTQGKGASSEGQTAETQKNGNGSDGQKELAVMSQGLSKAYASVSTSGEKEVIGIMQSTINSLMSDRSYDYRSQASVAKSAYSKLNSQEKQNVKAALFSSVDMENALKLSKIFGI